MKVKSKEQNPSKDFDDNYGQQYEDNKKWYEEISPDPAKFQPVTDQVLIELKDEAKKCLDSETATYNMKNVKSNPDYCWLKTVMSKGIVSDKIAAYTLLVQNNPVYNLETIRNLIGMVKVGKKKECIAVMETLSELFLSDLLRPNVKLKPFHQRPLSLLNEISSGNTFTRRKYLSYWYFEDQLKENYTTFVQALNTAAHDTVESNKEKAISAMTRLLSGNPEQEKNLLSNVINKMGDPSQKVASKTMYCLIQLLHTHSNMQNVVLVEIEKLLFRQNVGHKAQYYSLCFLSQFYLSHENPEVARKLIEVYFSFFKKCIKEGDVDSRMMSALLIGVNRAYPYAKLEMEKISEHIDTIYRIVHVASFTISVHALCLLYQVSEYSNSVNDRYYSALYKKLLDPKMMVSTHQAMLLNLIYKSMIRDTERTRILAFVKRLLQLCLYIQPNFACGILFLVSQIISRKENTNLLEILKSESGDEVDDDGEEKYVDIKEEEEPQGESQSQFDCKEDEEHEDKIDVVEITNRVVKKSGSWYHCTMKGTKNKNIYNPLARNPLYTATEHTAYVELNELKNHFHPSVSMFAEKILNGEKIVYSGDPLKDFILIRFLDRFVFKNPKRLDEIKNQSSFSTFGKRKLYRARGIKSISVMSQGYLNEKEKNIPVDELFMFTYLQKKYRNREEIDEDSDLESVASEDFENMLDKMSGFKETDEDIDFMNDIGNSLKIQSDRKGNGDESDEADSEEDGGDDDVLEEEFSDDEMDEAKVGGDLMEDGDDELLQGIDDDDDEGSGIVFGSDEDGDYDDESGNERSGDKKKKADKGAIFASAEEFALLLEDEGTSKRKPGSSNTFSNDDKADVKQLDWEEKRNRWLKGYDSAVGKGFKGKKRKSNMKQPKKFVEYTKKPKRL